MGSVRGVLIGLLAVGMLPGVEAGADSATPSSALLVQQHIRLARFHLGENRLADAEREARAALDASASDPEAEAVLGDLQFRQGDFAAAEERYRAALARSPQCARAHWGLGRIDQASFRHRSARQRFLRAYSLNPNDPATIAAYASTMTSPLQEIALLQRYLRLGRTEPRTAREAALGRLQLLEKLQGRQPWRLAGPYQPYHLPLAYHYPGPSPAAGVVLRVSLNGGRPLRLLLDSGARGVLLNATAVRDTTLEYLIESMVGGLGPDGWQRSQTALVRELRVGDELRFADALVEVADRPVAGQTDGIIGTNVFHHFQLRLHGPAKRLELQPFPDVSPEALDSEQPWRDHDRLAQDAGHATPLHRVGHMLLVPARVNRGEWRPFLLDTGAAFNAISPEEQDKVLHLTASRHLTVRGVSGFVEGVPQFRPSEVAIPGASMVDRSLIGFDLKPLSHRAGTRLSGLLGFALLQRTTIRFDYRDGLLTVEPER